MKTKTIKRTRPYLCTVCGGNGTDPKPHTVFDCSECEGTGILQIEELETWDDDAQPESEPEPISIFVSKDGGKTEEFTFNDLDPNDAATAARINARLRKEGYDASIVHSMTPLHMLEHAERRATGAEKRCENAQERERKWVDWFEELRRRYDGLARGGEGIPWHSLEEHIPWPSLEDERAEAIQDE